MERIVFLDREALQTDIRPPRFAHQWVEYATTPADQVSERLEGATIVISNRYSTIGNRAR